MKKVIFAKTFTPNAAPNADGAISIFDPKTNAYINLGHASTFASYERLDILYQRDGQEICIPVFPKSMTFNDPGSNTAFTNAAAQTVTIDLTGAVTETAAAGDTYTLEIIHKGHPNDNRCRKYVSVVYGATYPTTIDGSDSTGSVTTDDNLGGALCYAINQLSMPYISFSAAYTSSSDALVITVASGYYSEELKVNGLDELDVLVQPSGSLSIVYSHTVGWTVAQIQALEAEADSMLGNHGYNYRGTDFFNLASGYSALCDSLLVMTSSKPDDDTLALEPNFPQEIYLFYDRDGSGTSTVVLYDVIDWITGRDSSLDAS